MIKIIHLWYWNGIPQHQSSNEVVPTRCVFFIVVSPVAIFHFQKYLDSICKKNYDEFFIKNEKNKNVKNIIQPNKILQSLHENTLQSEILLLSWLLPFAHVIQRVFHRWSLPVLSILFNRKLLTFPFFDCFSLETIRIHLQSFNFSLSNFFCWIFHVNHMKFPLQKSFHLFLQLVIKSSLKHQTYSSDNEKMNPKFTSLDIGFVSAVLKSFLPILMYKIATFSAIPRCWSAVGKQAFICIWEYDVWLLDLKIRHFLIFLKFSKIPLIFRIQPFLLLSKRFRKRRHW